MPVYNADLFLRQAIDSILNQTYKHLEFIILDDGSTDNSCDIIESYSTKDKRIRAFYTKENRGIVYQLNKGISEARGRFIARMDADDISLPQRIEKQVSFLEQNSDISIVGSNVRFIVENRIFPRRSHLPLLDQEIKAYMLFFTPFYHPSVVLRIEIFHHFRYSEATIEDYALWIKVLSKFNAANIEECLLIYRRHNKNTTLIHQKKFHNDIHEIYREILNSLKIEFSENDVRILCQISESDNEAILLRDIVFFKELLHKVITNNYSLKRTEQSSLVKTIEKVWIKCLIKVKINSLKEMMLLIEHTNEIMNNMCKSIMIILIVELKKLLKIILFIFQGNRI